MNTFETIVYKLINIENNIFSPNYDNSDTVDGIYKMFFGCYIGNKNYKSKFHFLNETVNNFYFSQKDEERNKFINYFNKIQKAYHRLNRFTILYKIRKATQIVNTDLQLNEINLGQKNVISIYHNNYNYLFSIQDLLKIIYTSLTNTYMFFCEPITIKNPYNNLPFEKSILYYIYFHLINNTYIGYIKHEYVDIFLKFKQCNFNMTKFIDSFEYILREYAIKNYITNSTRTQIETDILKMISEYNICYDKYKINIDAEFPKDILIRIMKPYLHLYLTIHYSLVSKNRSDAKYKLTRKLKEFQKFNPAFGRKVIVFKSKINNGKLVRYKSHIDFNFEHKKLNVDADENFMSNHLIYKYSDDNIEDENDDFENVNVTTHRTITNFELFGVFLLENDRQINHEENEGDIVDEATEEEEDEATEEEDDADTNLESDTNSELVQDYYDEMPDEDSIS